MAEDVLIIGAGPVGLALAMDLAWRGVRPLVVERRPAGEPPGVKCNHVAARSMEGFRRLGIADAVRAAGLPDDYPHDVAYRTAFLGEELTRIPIPGRRARETAPVGPDADWPTPEPPHRVNQMFLEPILAELAGKRFGIEVLYETEFVELSQDADGVDVRLRDLRTGTERELRCRLVVGSDGGRSAVRRALGIRLLGDPVVQRVQSTLIRSTELPALLAARGGTPAWGTASMNERRCGIVYAIDGRETWLIHNYLLESEEGFDTPDRDRSIRNILGVDDAFRYEVVSNEDWFGRRLVAERIRDGRVFLCGDSAHIWVPFAGYGMNAGLADAFDLGWLLAGHLGGWAPFSILDAYEAERLPITEQVSHYAMQHAIKSAGRRRAVPPGLEEPGAAGNAVRVAYGQTLYDLNVQQYCCAGLNFGYFYDRSPLIAADDEPPPAYDMGSFTPSTVPGTRMPHVWLRDGRSLYDALGRTYTLLLVRPAEHAGLVAAAKASGLPLAVLDLSAEELPAAYRHALLVVRPDHHVAWRGDVVGDPGALVDMLRGAVPRAARAAVRAEAA